MLRELHIKESLVCQQLVGEVPEYLNSDTIMISGQACSQLGIKGWGVCASRPPPGSMAQQCRHNPGAADHGKLLHAYMPKV